MKLIHLLCAMSLIVATTIFCAEHQANGINIEIKTKSINSLMHNLESYIKNLPQIPNVIMQTGLTASGFTLTYKGAEILRNGLNHSISSDLTDITQDSTFFWSTVVGGSMVLLGLTTTLGASMITNGLISK